MAAKRPRNEHGAEDTTSFAWPECVRKRPSEYACTDERGLHYLIWKAVENAIDEVAAGYATTVEVTLLGDGGVQVADDGRGIPVAMHSSGVPTIDVVMATLTKGRAWRSTECTDYGDYGGSRHVGVSVVNALSARMEVEIFRDGYKWFQCYDHGVPGTALERGEQSTKTGTTVRFWADPTIFETTTYSLPTVAEQLQNTAFLNSGLAIRLVDERPRDYHYPNGLTAFVMRINRTKMPIHQSIIEISGKATRHQVDIAMQWNAGFSDSVQTFVNGINTSHEGGTHEEGFRATLISVLNKYAKDRKLLRATDPLPTGADICEGLAAVVSVKVVEPEFEGHSMTKLTNPEVGLFVRKVCRTQLTAWLDSHPDEAEVIVRKTISGALDRIKPRSLRADDAR